MRTLERYKLFLDTATSFRRLCSNQRCAQQKRSILVVGIVLFCVVSLLGQSSGRRPRSKENQPVGVGVARSGFYFNMGMAHVASYTGWGDEMLALFRSNGIPAFNGKATYYKNYSRQPFVPMQSLKIIRNSRNATDVWVGPFETEESAMNALARFRSVLYPIMKKNHDEGASLQHDAGSNIWEIGFIEIFGHRFQGR